MKQPQRMAVQIFDKKTIDMTRDEYRIRQVTKAEANTIEELAQKLEISAEGLVRTVREFNAACQPGDYNPAILDGKCHQGHHAAQVQLGAADRRTAVPRVRGDLRHHVQLRRFEDHTDGEVEDTTGPYPRPVRRRRTGRRLVLSELSGRRGVDVGSVFGRIAGRTAGQYAKG